MSVMVAVRDETTMGEITHEVILQFFTQQITVRELIRQRVRQEVERYNEKQTAFYEGLLVRPTAAETTLNGVRLRDKRHIDWEKQADVAEEAFMTNGFLLLAGDRQLTELDEVIELRPDMTISFLRLVPLVGG